MNPVVHFEMPTEVGKRMADFSAKFSVEKTHQLGEDMRNYVLISKDQHQAGKNAAMHLCSSLRVIILSYL